MDSRIQTLIEHSDKLFSDRMSLASFWQEAAENFYPERADFTVQRYIGQDFAANLTTSYPLLARRDLGNAFSAMLRPNTQPWFAMHTQREDLEDDAARAWLEWASGYMRRAMYSRPSGFVRATSQADHDFATFGQCVLSVELNREGNELLYRTWHLRDVVWGETYDGKTCPVYRKWQPPLRELNHEFQGNISPQLKARLEKTPFDKVEVRHAVVPSDSYEAPAGKKWKRPYVSVFFELESGHVLREEDVGTEIYVIPRWQTVSGSQYAYSPAVVAALPDSRLIQSMTLTLLEAGEKAANPPMVATHDVIRSDVALYAGGITWVDDEYDERLGEALRPLPLDHRGLPFGVEMRNDVREMIKEAFFLNKLNMPPQGGPNMTAFEVGQRVQEYIRQALPLFEPMETEYNAQLCERTFEIMLHARQLGRPEDMPDSIKRADIQFRFESPLHQEIERRKGQTWAETKAILADAVALDPSAAYLLDARTALRDTLRGIGTPAIWMRSDDELRAIDQQNQAKQQTAEMLQNLQAGGDAAQSIGKASQALGFSAAPATTKAA